VVDAEAAKAAGYTIVDLRDDWTPYIFENLVDGAGAVLPNRYRRIFIGLANDRLDSDGQPLDPGEANYLELYGIPPSLSVLRNRVLADEVSTCFQELKLDVLTAIESLSYLPPAERKRADAKLEALRIELEAKRVELDVDHKVPDLATLASIDAKLAPKIKQLLRRDAERAALAEVEKRLTCEAMLLAKARHTTGVFDDALQQALRRFQMKHMIYEGAYVRKTTLATLSKPPLESDFAALGRVVRERVVAAAGILEDGTATTKGRPATYVNAAGEQVEVPNLVEQYTKIALDQLGVTDAATTLAFFKRHAAEDFRWLRAAIKLPPPPEYYGPQMDLSIVVDRGDVWYELPFDAAGNWKLPARKRFPTLTVYLRYRGQRFALVRWRTTIGGWRSDQAADGYEYYRYKGSDVGHRVIRNIVAGPVWVAPESTPIRGLVKYKHVNGAWQRVVNYDELGPGYLSAYGLVAGYFVIPGRDGRGDSDNGIRAHGSSDYLSIYSANGYSHGCHRLRNHEAVRMYDFILAHRSTHVLGDSPMSFSRQFLAGDDVHEMRMPSRGYTFELTPPISVDVLKGNIQGKVFEPITTYVPKPGVRYPAPPPSTSTESDEVIVEGASPSQPAPGTTSPPAAPATGAEPTTPGVSPSSPNGTGGAQ
jgi:hypothetical protein